MTGDYREGDSMRRILKGETLAIGALVTPKKLKTPTKKREIEKYKKN